MQQEGPDQMCLSLQYLAFQSLECATLVLLTRHKPEYTWKEELAAEKMLCQIGP